MPPIFSIIVAAYNSEKYLKQCLDSIVKQTEKLIEIIIVNDGSHDNTWEIIDAYVREDSRIKAIHKIENEGKSKAIIDGFEIATGKYVSLIDSDDWIDKEYYSKIGNHLMESPEVLISGYISEPGGGESYYTLQNWINDVRKRFSRIKSSCSYIL